MGNFVHSFWSAPMLAGRRAMDPTINIELNMFTFACSAAWVKHCGGKIDLYADDFGKELLDIIPYDNVFTIVIPETMPVCSWACSKFYALEKMHLGDVHIDGDVYLKTTELLDMIMDSNYDFVVQSVEDDREILAEHYDATRAILQRHQIQTNGCLFSKSPSYNCGTVGFFNNKLKKSYLDEYFTTLRNMTENAECVHEMNCNERAIPDLILEQQFLFELGKEYRCHNLLGNSDSIYDRALELNYQHVLGAYKVQQLPQIRAELHYVDHDLYNKVVYALEHRNCKNN